MEEKKQTVPITEWANADQPREKLLEKGKGILTDAELIGILIGSGSKTETAVELARRILSSVGNDLNALGKLNVAQLCKFKGIGEAKAISIIAALELGKRMKVLESPQRIRINNSKLVFEAIRNEIGDLLHEEFWVLYLDRSNHIIRKSNISKGGVSGTVVDARIIFKQAIENLASSIVLCHNHPSGNLKPSEEDIRITKKLKDAGKLVDIAIIDHIIIAGNNFFSFADEGLL
ncbi:MAG: DNA repair protein RadC [Bacteroidetes bacterium]|nr:DNA repair protein RadC [Bacteroidota bacterium]MBK9671375.1 DNA repair protein RadC [Bacteroidota bacterium]MBP6412206.1 DNA repair protein RadC [Bacteroidia bacterium]